MHGLVAAILGIMVYISLSVVGNILDTFVLCIFC